jgi:uncharacterized protein (DUF924 family)
VLPPRSEPEKLLEFWFADAAVSPGRASARSDMWFGASPVFDRECRMRYRALLESARRGALDAWRETARTALALVVLLDQIPRNIFRGSTRMYAFDARALENAIAACEAGFAAELHPIEAVFFYMPFEHAENAAMQERAVARGAGRRRPARVRGHRVGLRGLCPTSPGGDPPLRPFPAPERAARPVVDARRAGVPAGRGRDVSAVIA